MTSSVYRNQPQYTSIAGVWGACRPPTQPFERTPHPPTGTSHNRRKNTSDQHHQTLTRLAHHCRHLRTLMQMQSRPRHNSMSHQCSQGTNISTAHKHRNGFIDISPHTRGGHIPVATSRTQQSTETCVCAPRTSQHTTRRGSAAVDWNALSLMRSLACFDRQWVIVPFLILCL